MDKLNFLVLFALLGFYLSGCGGKLEDNDNPETNQQASPSTLLNDISYSDQGFKACIERLAASNKWKTVADVTKVSCRFLSKNRWLSYDGFINKEITDQKFIANANDLHQFTEIEELDLSGNFYTSIDVSSLKNLKTLNLSNSFIKELDIGENRALELLNVTATAVSKLNLINANNLQELYASHKGKDEDLTYSRFVLSKPNQPFNVTIEEIEKVKIDVIFSPDAQLKIIEFRKNTVLDLSNSQYLQKASAHFSNRTLNDAVRLEEFNGKVSIGNYLDLSKAENLRKFDFTSDSIKSMVIHQNLTSLRASAPIQMFETPNNAHIQSLVIEHPATDPDEYLDASNIHINPGVINHLTLSGYDFGERIDLTELTSLESLRISNSTINELVVIPENLGNLSLAKLNNNVKIQPTESLTSLSLSEVTNEICSLNNLILPRVEKLDILDCASTKLKLENSPMIQRLFMSNSKVEALNFSSNTEVQTIFLSASQLKKFDLESLKGRQRETLLINGSNFEEEELNKLKQDSRDLFKTVTISQM